MRKFLLAAAAFALTVGLTVAAPVAFVKYDEEKMEITVKEGKKNNKVDKTYKLTKDTKFKDGDKDVKTEDAVKMLTDKEKPQKMVDLKVEDDKVTEVKLNATKKPKTSN